MINRKKIFSFFTIFVIILISSCSNNNITINEKVTSISIPTPENDLGTVTGIVKGSGIYKNLEVNLYLSKNITYGNPELPPTISFSHQSNPRGVLDQNSGTFYFPNIEPGDNYVITIFTPPGDISYVKNMETNTLLQIQVKAGEITDLGTIYIP